MFCHRCDSPLDSAAKGKTAHSLPRLPFPELFRPGPGWLATTFSARRNLAE